MIRIGVIGSAGRHEDGALLTKETYTKAYQQLLVDLKSFEGSSIQLVSGGAACADHLAVKTYLNGHASALELHFPAPFKNSSFESKGFKSPGNIANYYHRLMSQNYDINSLQQIQIALDRGATSKTYNGFYTRNIEVGRCDVLVAFTFGTKSGSYTTESAEQAGLKDGGSAHCFNNSTAPLKLHHNLWEYID